MISSMAVKEARESSRPFSSKTGGLRAAKILRDLPSAKALCHENLQLVKRFLRRTAVTADWPVLLQRKMRFWSMYKHLPQKILSTLPRLFKLIRAPLSQELASMQQEIEM